MKRTFRAFLVALVVTTLLPGAAFARVLFECAMTGRVAPSCCCKASSAHGVDGAKERREPAKLQRAGCCETVSAEFERRDATVAPDAGSVAPPGLVAVLPVPPAVAPPAVALRVDLPRARGPPAADAPLYLQNCSLLR